jgi:hypothetical protein
MGEVLTILVLIISLYINRNVGKEILRCRVRRVLAEKQAIDLLWDTRKNGDLCGGVGGVGGGFGAPFHEIRNNKR